MSPRKREKKDIQDSTTDFFLKVVQKEKEQKNKVVTKTEKINDTTSKTFDRVGRFYNYINQTLDKILSSRISVMGLSLIMALVLFVNISGGDILTSPTSGTTLENVPLRVEGLNDQYEVSGLPKEVTVGLIGPSLDIYTTKLSKNYEVFVDLTGYQQGDYAINIQTKNFPESLTVFAVPDTISISISPKVNRTFDLGYRFMGEDQLDAKYSIRVDQMDLKDVTIRASEATLDKIASVEACIDVANKTEDFKQEAKIHAYDANGKELNVEIKPSMVSVECSVDSYSKDVTIMPHFVGNLQSGYQISRYSLSQSTVTIYGAKEYIDKISTISVDINVEGLGSSTTLTAQPLKKENGINKLSTNTIDIDLEIDKVITKRFDNIPIKVLNNSKNKVSFVGNSQYASVLVTGSEEKVSTLTQENIQATIDVNRLGLGTKKVNVKVAVDDEQLKIELLSSSKVSINIERK